MKHLCRVVADSFGGRCCIGVCVCVRDKVLHGNKCITSACWDESKPNLSGPSLYVPLYPFPMTIQVGPRAFALPLLHAAKHPEALVCGVLLGQVHADGSLDVKTGIPFFHHWTSMSPMLEIALQQV